jgi:hypothetical protein
VECGETLLADDTSMRCPRCGTLYPADCVFCVECGATLVVAIGPGGAQSADRVPVPRQRRGRGPALAAVLLVALAALGLGALWWLRARAPSSPGRLAYIVQSDSRSALWLATVESSAALRAFGGADEIRYLHVAGERHDTPFLPRSQDLVFVARSGDVTSVYRLKAGTSSPDLLFKDTGDVQGAVSADGRALLVRTRRGADPYRLLWIDTTGGRAPQLVAEAPDVQYELSPRADLVLVRVARDGQTHLDLVGRQGQTAATLANGDAAAWATFSPDGGRLLCWTAGVTQPLGSLALLEAAHPERRQELLTINAAQGGFLDGGRSVWVETAGDPGRSLLLLDVASGRSVQVAVGWGEQGDLAVQGSRLYFAVQAGASRDLYAVDADSSHLRFLARGVIPVTLQAAAVGSALVWAEGQEQQWTLHLQANGSLRLGLTRPGARPGFSRDGRWIAFEQASGDGNAVWLCQTDGSQRRLVAQSAYAPVWSR